MEATFYRRVFARYGIAVVAPDDADRAWIHERYVGQLLRGEFRDDTRQQIIALIARLREENRLGGVILGGTELPLLLPRTFQCSTRRRCMSQRIVRRLRGT